MNREFYELCYRHYRDDMQEANGHDQRAGAILLILLLLVAISVRMVSVYMVGDFGVAYIFSSDWIFLMYLCAAATYGLAFLSLIGLYLSTIPYRRQFIANLDHWQNVARQHGDPSAAKPSDPSDTERQDNGFYGSICDMLVKAQSHNAEINAKRRQCLRVSIFFAANAAMALAGQAIFTLIQYL